MAAVRCRSYRHQEFREREFNPKISGRRDYRQGRYHDGDRPKDIRSCFRDRQRESKERESVNGYHGCPLISSNSSGGSGNDQKQIRLRSVDRDPGASRGRSDDLEASVSRVRDDSVRKFENGALPFLSKKRKFSPILGDRGDIKRSRFITSRIQNGIQEPVAVPPPPPLPQVGIPPHSIKKMQQSEERLLPSDVKDSVDTLLDLQWNNDWEPGEIEVEENEKTLMRNINTSRWADFDDEEVVPKSRSTASSHLPDQLSCEKEQSPLEDSMVKAQETPEQVHLPQRHINMLQGCRSVHVFERLNKINEGTYGVVHRARDRKTGEIVALKKVKMERESESEGFPLTSLREINILSSLRHSSIVGVNEVVVEGNPDRHLFVYMVMEYMEHDLKGLMEMMEQPFNESEVKCLMQQLLEGVDYLHNNLVLHRDLKTSNLLMNNRGELKICDFGLSHHYGSPLKPYTHLVVTLWYRAPELLLGAKEYSTAIDMWSVGCIMAELLAKKPLFNGNTEFDQLDKIFRIFGAPNEKIWPGFAKLPGVKVDCVKKSYNKHQDKFRPITSLSGCPALSEAGFDLLNNLLTCYPEKRITAKMALNHAWFHEIPLPKSKEFMPKFSARHAQDRCQKKPGSL